MSLLIQDGEYFLYQFLRDLISDRSGNLREALNLGEQVRPLVKGHLDLIDQELDHDGELSLVKDNTEGSHAVGRLFPQARLAKS